MLAEFIEYLTEQLKMPYVWGGQHLKLTPDTYESIIHKKEDGRGGYSDGTTYADASIAYCKKLFDNGAEVLYAYDCSGLGMYFLQNLHHIYRSDMNANAMMGKCELQEDSPKMGWWVFRVSNGKATHIGYMIDDAYLIEAKGRKYGVCKTKFKVKDWSKWGIPVCFKDEIIDPPTDKTVKVVGKSVNVRDSDSTKGRILFTAHRGDTFPFVAVAPSGWYEIETNKGTGYITNKTRYTELI